MSEKYYKAEDVAKMGMAMVGIANTQFAQLLQGLPTYEAFGDAISRESFREQMYHRCFECDNNPNMQKWDSGCWIRYSLFIEELDKAPSVFPVRPQGVWIDDGFAHHCSICGKQGVGIEYYNYCPYCGSRMKGADDEYDK